MDERDQRQDRPLVTTHGSVFDGHLLLVGICYDRDGRPAGVRLNGRVAPPDLRERLLGRTATASPVPLIRHIARIIHRGRAGEAEAVRYAYAALSGRQAAVEGRERHGDR